MDRVADPETRAKRERASKQSKLDSSRSSLERNAGLASQSEKRMAHIVPARLTSARSADESSVVSDWGAAFASSAPISLLSGSSKLVSRARALYLNCAISR